MNTLENHLQKIEKQLGSSVSDVPPYNEPDKLGWHLNKIEDLLEQGGGGTGTTVIANPTLEGDEDALIGLQVGNTKFKVDSGGSGQDIEILNKLKDSNLYCFESSFFSGNFYLYVPTALFEDKTSKSISCSCYCFIENEDSNASAYVIPEAYLDYAIDDEEESFSFLDYPLTIDESGSSDFMLQLTSDDPDIVDRIKENAINLSATDRLENVDSYSVKPLFGDYSQEPDAEYVFLSIPKIYFTNPSVLDSFNASAFLVNSDSENNLKILYSVYFYVNQYSDNDTTEILINDVSATSVEDYGDNLQVIFEGTDAINLLEALNEFSVILTSQEAGGPSYHSINFGGDIYTIPFGGIAGITIHDVLVDETYMLAKVQYQANTENPDEPIEEKTFSIVTVDPTFYDVNPAYYVI